jgi:hypothetical protein
MKTLLCTLLFAGATYSAPLLTLDPLGGVVLRVPAVATFGWGFSITNTTDFLVVTGSTFTPPSPLGTYEDFISTFNFIVVGPAPESTVVSQLFNPILHTGVGAFHFNPVFPYVPIDGILTIHYALFSVSPHDPNFNPGHDLITSDATLSQAVSIATTPEPSSLLLLTAAALPFVIALKRRRRLK